MTGAFPPLRPAHYFAEEEGFAREEARLSPFYRITGWARGGLDFRGEAAGRVWLVNEARGGRAELGFTSDRGDGTIRLESCDNGWIRVEVVRNGGLLLRAWLDQPYEELEFWPDAADGEGEAPGRISKRGSWLSIDCSRFPGVPAGEGGWFSLEEAGGRG